MFLGYLAYDGVEIANSNRTKAYAEAACLDWVRNTEECDTLNATLGIPAYIDPATDLDCPWYDEVDPDTAAYKGLIITSIDGVDSSTHQAVVTEALGDGATVSPFRHGSRTVVVRGVLVSSNEAGVQVGLDWLENVLHKGDPCKAEADKNPRLSLFRACPQDSRTPYFRDMYDTFLTGSVQMLRQVKMSTGWMGEVEFVMTSEQGWLYQRGVDVTTDLQAFTYQFVKDNYLTYSEVNAEAPTYEELGKAFWQKYLTIPATLFRGPEKSYVEPMAAPQPLAATPSCAQDPDCPPIVSFPGAPQGISTCRADWTGGYTRLSLPVTTKVGPSWGDVVFILEASAALEDHKDIRVRTTPIAGDPDLDYISQFFITWLPAGGTFTIHTPRQRNTLTCSGETVEATHLLYSDVLGQPFRFPVVQCAQEYVVTLDVRDVETADDLDLSLTLVRRDR